MVNVENLESLVRKVTKVSVVFKDHLGSCSMLIQVYHLSFVRLHVLDELLSFLESLVLELGQTDRRTDRGEAVRNADS